MLNTALPAAPQRRLIVRPIALLVMIERVNRPRDSLQLLAPDQRLDGLAGGLDERAGHRVQQRGRVDNRDLFEQVRERESTAISVRGACSFKNKVAHSRVTW